ncbi:MAG TPA: UDP-3-O-acyl-N-acetylglucosamine deacetylase [Abditibacterium sp.]|jgi:UDP-3-O-[3-hydroxymyristoyl] N-acetylglucosamine deacetylase
MRQFHTLNRTVEMSGIGLHCGQEISLSIVPDERPGWRFARRDLPGSPEIVATLENVVATQHATVLRHDSASVSTTEHLLAALWTQEITHARIEINGPEVPILDGSAQPWVEAIEHAGTQKVDGERPVWKLQNSVWWESGNTGVLGVPNEGFRLSVTSNFDHQHAGPQIVDLEVTARNFARELAPARTFTLENWLAPLREAGLIRGGSLENAILVSDSGLSTALRFPNEMARHKALDCVGDLALLFGGDGGSFEGHIIATRAGHGAHRAWMEMCRNLGVLQRV